jgi:hypothetical protein
MNCWKCKKYIDGLSYRLHNGGQEKILCVVCYMDTRKEMSL